MEFSNISISPDGERVAFSRDVAGQGDIVIWDLTTGEEDTVVSSDASETNPAFSPDGNEIAFVSNADGDDDIYLKDLTNEMSVPTNLTNNAVADWAPAFGDSGTDHGPLIAYVNLQADMDTEIYTMTPTGADKTNLTNNAVLDFGPNWHPDFDKLAFSSQDPEGRDQVFTMNYNGSNPVPLTSGSSYNYEPAWSPDGSRIAFTRQGAAPGSKRRVFVRATTGGTAVPITGTDTDYDRAEWQPRCADPACQPDPKRPKLFFTLANHLRVKGGVDGPGTTTGGVCGTGTPIKIQRYVNGAFKTIASTKTGAAGVFSKAVPDKPGRYRIGSSSYVDPPTGTQCLAATTQAKRHKHPVATSQPRSLVTQPYICRWITKEAEGSASSAVDVGALRADSLGRFFELAGLVLVQLELDDIRDAAPAQLRRDA